MNPLYLIPAALIVFVLGIVVTKVWAKYAPNAEAAAYSDGVKLLQRISKLTAATSAEEQAKVAAEKAHLAAMKAAFKVEADKLLA